MSDTEAIMWAVEKDPALRSDFCNLTILEHVARRRSRAATRWRGRVGGDPAAAASAWSSAPLRIVPPAFADDPTLDLDAHVRRRRAARRRQSDRALLDLCGSLAEQPLDRARPLWEFTIIDGLPDGRAALLQKIHHTITDGVGGLRLSLAFVDFEPDAPVPETPTRAPEPNDGAVDAEHGTPLQASRTRGGRRDVARRSGWRGARSATPRTCSTHPTEIPGRAVDTARARCARCSASCSSPSPPAPT